MSRSPRMIAFQDSPPDDWVPKVGEEVWVPFHCKGGFGGQCRHGTVMLAEPNDFFYVRGWYRDKPRSATYGRLQLRPGAPKDERTVEVKGELVESQS
jgi:hypothetical protein